MRGGRAAQAIARRSHGLLMRWQWSNSTATWSHSTRADTRVHQIGWSPTRNVAHRQAPFFAATASCSLFAHFPSPSALGRRIPCGRCWFRTSDLCRVKAKEGVRGVSPCPVGAGQDGCSVPLVPLRIVPYRRVHYQTITRGAPAEVCFSPFLRFDARSPRRRNLTSCAPSVGPRLAPSVVLQRMERKRHQRRSEHSQRPAPGVGTGLRLLVDLTLADERGHPADGRDFGHHVGLPKERATLGSS